MKSVLASQVWWAAISSAAAVSQVAGRRHGGSGSGQVAGAGGGRGHWSLTSAAAARAAASSAMVLRVAQVAMSAATASRLTARG